MISPLRSKLHETMKATIVFSLFLWACPNPDPPARKQTITARQRPDSAPPSSSRVPSPLDKTKKPPPLQEITPLVLGPLRQEPVSAVVKKLVEAHYDPTRMGLAQLAFSVQFSWDRHQLQVKAEGRWKKDAPPHVEIISLKRRGTHEVAPQPDGTSQQVWRSMKGQLENLLEGIGRGFLSERLAQWQEMEGQVTMKKGLLQLQLGQDGEGGGYTVTIGPGYVIQEVTQRSADGVTRTMTYTVRSVAGRNMVTKALYRARVDKGSSVGPRIERLIQGSDKMLFEIMYGQVGGYYLPRELRKKMPGTGDDIRLTITYLTVKP